MAIATNLITAEDHPFIRRFPVFGGFQFAVVIGTGPRQSSVDSGELITSYPQVLKAIRQQLRNDDGWSNRYDRRVGHPVERPFLRRALGERQLHAAFSAMDTKWTMRGVDHLYGLATERCFNLLVTDGVLVRPSRRDVCELEDDRKHYWAVDREARDSWIAARMLALADFEERAR